MDKIIYLDTRENNDEFISYLVENAESRGYTVKLEALPFGDIRYENIVIERKEVNDFASSVCSDRMVNQIATMKANCDYNSIIALTGTYRDLWKNNVDKIPRMEGMKKQILAWGIPFIHCLTDEELVDRAFELFEYASIIDVPVKRVNKDSKLSMFMALPHIGRKNAKKIIKSYKNMVELCEADEKSLRKILGEKKGKIIFEALRN